MGIGEELEAEGLVGLGEGAAEAAADVLGVAVLAEGVEADGFEAGGVGPEGGLVA